MTRTAPMIFTLFTSLVVPAFSAGCVSSETQKAAFCALWGGFTSNGFTLPSGMNWACTYPTPGSSLQPVNEPCTSWAGVVCDPACNAVALNLGRAGISGTLSPYIGQLQSLQGLFLYENNIGGALPGEIANLANLNALCIDHNQFTGTFPKITFFVGPLSKWTQHMPGQMIGLTQLSLLTADYNNFNCYSSVFTKTYSSNGLFYLSQNGAYFDPNLPICGRECLSNTPPLFIRTHSLFAYEIPLSISCPDHN